MWTTENKTQSPSWKLRESTGQFPSGRTLQQLKLLNSRRAWPATLQTMASGHVLRMLWIAPLGDKVNSITLPGTSNCRSHGLSDCRSPALQLFPWILESWSPAHIKWCMWRSGCPEGHHFVIVKRHSIGFQHTHSGLWRLLLSKDSKSTNSLWSPAFYKRLDPGVY